MKQMRSHHLYLSSPRSSSKQLKPLPSLQLNSYKIDTSSLEQKAKQIQQLKTQLQTQISHYQVSQSMYHSQIDKLTQQNNQLKLKIKRLQQQLKSNPQPTPIPKSPSKPFTNQIKLLNTKIQSLQDQLSIIKQQLKNKLQYINQLQQYKKMYDIQVENKNNIMNFYQNKLKLFQKDKITLISKYQQKISQLGSNLQANATIIQQGINNNTISVFNNNSTMPNGISKINSPPKPITNLQYNQYKNNNQTNLQKHKIESKYSAYSQKNITTNKQQSKQPQKPTSSKNIKFIRPKKSQNSISQSKKSIQINQYQTQTPYKLFKNSSTQQSRNKQNTPYSNKSKQINQISISSSGTKNQQNMLISNNKNKLKQSSNKNLSATYKTIKSDDQFIQMIKRIYKNLRSNNTKSQNIKSFPSVRSIMNTSNPLISQIIQLLDKYPFGPIQMQHLTLQSCIQKMKRHLYRKYQRFSGSLLIQLLIDKIQDMEIANQVNSQDDVQIMAGLSSGQDDQE